jgi:hypothetical protein
MTTVTVYQFTAYDIKTDESRKSRRWGTREAIKGIGGAPLEHTATEVDASVVASDIPGLTGRDFDPDPRTGFQTSVRPDR